MKKSIEDVKNFLSTYDINNECELLSTEYVNSKTPLKFKCNICGRDFERDFTHLQRKRFKCPDCGKKQGGGKNKFSIEDVRKYIQENDIDNECELLSTEYINSKVPLKFKCNICGEDFERDFIHVKRGRFKCSKCGTIEGAKKLKYSKEYVEKTIKEEKGYVLTGEYINAGTKVKCKCSKGHEFDLIFSDYLIGHSGCKQCANNNLKGENNYNWKNGGNQEVTDYLRHHINSWKQEQLAKANYVCDISGEKHNLVVHHLTRNFSDIRDEAFKNLNLPIYNKISDYSEEEKTSLVNEVLRLHKNVEGVVLTKEIHNEFHQKYGKQNNTKEQYEEFRSSLKVI